MFEAMKFMWPACTGKNITQSLLVQFYELAADLIVLWNRSTVAHRGVSNVSPLSRRTKELQFFQKWKFVLVWSMVIEFTNGNEIIIIFSVYYISFLAWDSFPCLSRVLNRYNWPMVPWPLRLGKESVFFLAMHATPIFLMMTRPGNFPYFVQCFRY